MVSTAVSTTQVLVYQRALWWLPFAPVLWLHLSQKVTHSTNPTIQKANPTGQMSGKQWSSFFKTGILDKMCSSSMLGFLYGIALIFKMADLFTNSMMRFDLVRLTSLPLKSSYLPVGPFFLLFAFFSFIVILLASVNFIYEWRKNRQAEFLWLSIGSVCFSVSSLGLAIKTMSGITTGFAYGNSILAVGIFVVAIAILRHNALVKKEQLEHDIIYASAGAFGIMTIYIVALIAGQGSVSRVPVISVAVIAALALTSHMLADNIKIWFSRIIGTRFGLFSKQDVDKMQRLYEEVSRVKRQPAPVVDIFEDGDDSAQKLKAILTPRQREIITLRAKGFSDKQIAAKLDIKLPTVRKHVEDIKNRLGSRDKADCAVYCIVTGLLGKEDLIDWFDSLNIADNGSEQNHD
jgi:DNA-binding CsgD family transcriptional regulator